MYGHVITKFSGMVDLLSNGAPPTRARSARVELRYKDNLLMCNHEKFQSMSLGSKHKNKQMKIDVMNNDILRVTLK